MSQQMFNIRSSFRGILFFATLLLRVLALSLDNWRWQHSAHANACAAAAAIMGCRTVFPLCLRVLVTLCYAFIFYSVPSTHSTFAISSRVCSDTPPPPQ